MRVDVVCVPLPSDGETRGTDSNVVCGMKRGDGDFVATADCECQLVPKPKPAQHAARTVLFHGMVRPIC